MVMRSAALVATCRRARQASGLPVVARCACARSWNA